MPNTVISSAAVNSDFSDIADALTESLARDGQGGMQAVLPMDATGFTYNNDTNTGMYRTGADAQAIKCGGIDIVDIDSTGIDVTGAIKQNGISMLPVGLGPLPWSRVAAPAGWLFVGKLYSRTTYAALWAIANTEIGLGNTFYSVGDGTTTFGVGISMPGRVPACNDSISGTPAGLLTSATMTPDGATLGATGGAQTETIAQTNLPAVTLATAIAANQGSHAHSTVGAGAAGGTPNQVQILNGNGAFSFVSGTQVLPAMTGTTPLGGSGTPLTNVQPTIITNYIIFAGV